MILLKDIRDYVATLNVAADDHCYCGILPDKEEKSIGTYNLKSGRTPRNIAGGDENASYYTKGISFLVHWNRFPVETEEVSISFYEKLKETRNVTVNKHSILFVEMNSEEPIPVGTDENNIFEYVIECIFYVRKDEKALCQK